MEYPTYLIHYGIPGQKWGIRRFQNEDGTYTDEGRYRRKGEYRKQSLVKNQLGIDIKRSKFRNTDIDRSKETHLKKGSNVYHVTPNKFKEFRKGQDLFVSATDRDRDLYKSMLTMQMRKKGIGKNSSINELTLKLNKDLNAPSNEIQKKIFNTVYLKNKKVFDEDIRKNTEKNSKNSKDPYDMFIKTLNKKHKSKDMFYSELRKNGYNAVLDQHDVSDSWMQASRPLILMDALNDIGDIKIRKITDKDIRKSLKKLGIL